MRENRLRRHALSLGLLVAVAACGGGPAPTLSHAPIDPSAFSEGGRVLFQFDVDPNGTTVRQIEIEVGRRASAESAGFWQERIQAVLRLEGETAIRCCWSSPRSITQPFNAWIEDAGVSYTEPGTGWDLRAVITYRRDGETADRTAFGATVTQLTP